MTFWRVREELSKADRLRRSYYELLRDELDHFLLKHALIDSYFNFLQNGTDYNFVEKKLKNHFGLRSHKLSRISKGPISPSGRVLQMKVAFQKKKKSNKKVQSFLISANDFRRVLGFGRLKSTQFSWKIKRGIYHFKGRGFGHGVGMCQWGAKHLAARGMKFIDILSHYYPRTSLQSSIYDSIKIF